MRPIYIVQGMPETMRRFFDALHFYADGTAAFKRLPIIIASSPAFQKRWPWEKLLRYEVELNEAVPEVRDLFVMLALAAGVEISHNKYRRL